LLLDANAIIDLVKLGVLAEVVRLQQYEVLVTPIVRGEVRRPEQAEALAAAIAAGAIGEVALESAEEQALMAPITKAIGPGDAECLAATSWRGGVLASDETRRKFMREARRLIGEERLVRLHTLLAEAIAANRVTMERLHGALAVWLRPRRRRAIEMMSSISSRCWHSVRRVLVGTGSDEDDRRMGAGRCHAGGPRGRHTSHVLLCTEARAGRAE